MEAGFFKGGGTGNTILAAALSALVVMLGAYFTLERNTITRGEMETYVQTNSPFAHEQALFDRSIAQLDHLQIEIETLKLSHQQIDDQLKEINRRLARIEAGERTRG